MNGCGVVNKVNLPGAVFNELPVFVCAPEKIIWFGKYAGNFVCDKLECYVFGAQIEIQSYLCHLYIWVTFDVMFML